MPAPILNSVPELLLPNGVVDVPNTPPNENPCEGGFELELELTAGAPVVNPPKPPKAGVLEDPNVPRLGADGSDDVNKEGPPKDVNEPEPNVGGAIAASGSCAGGSAGGAELEVVV